MADVLGLAASAAGGGVFGLFGTALGRVAGFFERRQRHAQERARWAHDAAMTELRMRADKERTEGDIALADTSGAWSGLTASIEADAAIAESYQWVAAVRGLTRPALTFLLWAIATVIYLGGDASAQSQVTETATFAATAATLWWFGDRGPRQDRAR